MLSAFGQVRMCMMMYDLNSHDCVWALVNVYIIITKAVGAYGKSNITMQ